MRDNDNKCHRTRKSTAKDPRPDGITHPASIHLATNTDSYTTLRFASVVHCPLNVRLRYHEYRPKPTLSVHLRCSYSSSQCTSLSSALHFLGARLRTSTSLLQAQADGKASQFDKLRAGPPCSIALCHATKSVGLVPDKGNDHAVEVEEEHDQVETQLDE